MEDPLARLLILAAVCGVGGSLLGLLYSLFGKGEDRPRVEITTGVGFLIGASLGALFGIFAIMAGKL